MALEYNSDKMAETIYFNIILEKDRDLLVYLYIFVYFQLCATAIL